MKIIHKIGNAWVAANPRTRIIVGVVGVLLALCTLGQLADNGSGATSAAPPATSPATATTPADAGVSAPAPAETTTAALTVAQSNAAESARRYLAVAPFSRSGLIGQLGYEGYSEADATLAVDSLAVDWTAQADRKAAEYLALMPFSRSGLIEQLMFDGFSREDAEHGTASVGL